MSNYRLVEGVDSDGWFSRIDYCHVVHKNSSWREIARFRDADDSRLAWHLIKTFKGHERIFESLYFDAPPVVERGVWKEGE